MSDIWKNREIDDYQRLCVSLVLEKRRFIKKLTEIHEITQDTSIPAVDKIDNIAATAMSALHPGGCIVEEPNDVNDAYARGEHIPGVTR